MGESRSDSNLYFRQLLSGRDFARGDEVAAQMVNFVYAIGDRSTGECVLVDPAYAPDELLEILASDGMRLTGVLASHYHADHIGGDLFNHSIAGIRSLLDQVEVPVHVNTEEIPWVERTTGVTASELIGHRSADTLSVGDVEIEFIHTPGHTPGSQCFLVRDQLVSGDTLFLDGCGRTDLPGSDPAEMLESLRLLSRVDDAVTLFPGHRYSAAPSASMRDVKASNWVFDQL